MPLQYPEVLQLREEGRRFDWSERDAMLYALAIGLGSDPLNRAELPFVYEKNLLVVPTLATVVAWGAGIPPDRIGLDRRRTLHGEEALELHSPMPASGSVIADSRVVEVYDKGKDKGAVVVRETRLRDAQTGMAIATITRTAFARGDGGFGGPSNAPPAPEPPSREPDAVIDYATRADQALLYRLCGDRNPLHADPDIAQAAGFERPILHGLCTYGLCCRAVLEAFCSFDPHRLKRFSVRFSAPVLPGDGLRVKLWQQDRHIHFEAEVPARKATVIRSGLALLDLSDAKP